MNNKQKRAAARVKAVKALEAATEMMNWMAFALYRTKLEMEAFKYALKEDAP